MDKTTVTWAVVVSASVFAFGYVIGFLTGLPIGEDRADQRWKAREARLEREMKDVGLCPWAKTACSSWTDEDTRAWEERVRQGITE